LETTNKTIKCAGKETITLTDILAGIIELTGSWLVGNKRKIGFAINILGNIAWIIVAFKMKVYGLLIVVIPALFINIRNYFKWKEEEKVESFW